WPSASKAPTIPTTIAGSILAFSTRSSTHGAYCEKSTGSVGRPSRPRSSGIGRHLPTFDDHVAEHPAVVADLPPAVRAVILHRPAQARVDAEQVVTFAIVVGDVQDEDVAVLARHPAQPIRRARHGDR